MIRILTTGLLAGSIALALNFVIASLALRFTGVPRGFPPFTILPLAAGSIGGALLAALVYAAMQSLFPHSGTTFPVIAGLTLLVSFLLPLRLSYTKSPRFAGVTLPAQITLGVMHTVVAVCSVSLLLRRSMS